MSEWMRKIVVTLAGVVLIAAMVRLAWELLRPAVPALVVLLCVVAILAHVLRKPKEW
jgi:hypothetical protein